MNYSKYLIDVVNSRFPSNEIKKNNEFRDKIYSISFFESMVAIKIDSRKSIENTDLNNETRNLENINDLRNNDYFPNVSSL